MREHPIIFSGPMVRAILEGRKTQTRRVVKPQPSAGVRDSVFARSGLEDGHGRELRCPYGQPGDRLWVRETWGYRCGIGVNPTTEAVIEYRADRARSKLPVPNGQPGLPRQRPNMTHPELLAWWGRWRPSIHMPRWASRITLEITDVRVERVQDISEADARAEGVLWVPGHGEIEPADLEEGYSNYLNCRGGFQVLWDSINAKKYPWSANPWVWALTFKRVEE